MSYSVTDSQVTPHVIGCDIGGANLKLADNWGRTIACSFPMWLKSAELGSRLTELLRNFPLNAATKFAITMTGELADCFASRREGVLQILQQAEQAFTTERTVVYAVGNRWFSPAEAIDAPWEVAASNWCALATWIGKRSLGRVDLVLDIGSTTVDIIPMHNDPTHSESATEPLVAAPARIATLARTDRDRLELGQLVYTGMERTPIAAILNTVTLQGQVCPVMAERFATSDDCFILLGLAPEHPEDCESADNRPRTKAFAHARLARMIGEDAETLPFGAAMEIANQCIDAQATQIARAIDRNLPTARSVTIELKPLYHITVVGHGRPLAERALGMLSHRSLSIRWLADQLSGDAARCAPALAVAELRAACCG